MKRQHVFVYAIIGFTVSLLINVLCIVGIALRLHWSVFGVLFVGIMPMWMYVVFGSIKDDKIRASLAIPALSFNDTFENLPQWTRVLIVIFFLYTIVNTLPGLIFMGGSPLIVNGEYAIVNHGRIIKTLTEAKYKDALIQETCMMTGFLIIFYGVAVITLFNPHKYPTEIKL